jgi:hypothetical protein
MPETSDLFEETDYYTGPPIDEEMVRRAEESLGVRLPRRYIELLSERNGGVLRRRCWPTSFPTSWAPDHFAVQALLGLNVEMGIDGTFGSKYMIPEWGYPDIGIVIFDTPSAGHDTVMLDYRESGPFGEPAVAYIDEDRIPRRVANSFSEFIDGLVSCDQFIIGP